MSDLLKLVAMDTDDLMVISACTQDAVILCSEINFDNTSRSLVLPLKRFAWEAKGARRKIFKTFERRASVLHFNQVSSVRSFEINRTTDDVLSLLSIDFTPHHPDDVAGTLRLNFSGNATLEAKVDCIEGKLTDLGAAWSARAKPRHSV